VEIWVLETLSFLATRDIHMDLPQHNLYIAWLGNKSSCSVPHLLSSKVAGPICYGVDVVLLVGSYESVNCQQAVKFKALFSSYQKPKTFQDFQLHRILRHMHGVLNINKNKN
jgi:hypothetical protein